MRFDELFVYADGKGPDDWMLCIHCEHVSSRHRWEATDGCPRRGCDGTPLDAFPWSHIREGHPDYPETPEDGAHYPLY